MTWIRRHLTYANVVSTLALLAVLSTGTAYAAAKITGRQIAKDTITARNLHADSVGRSELAPKAVTGREVLDGSVTTKDLKDGVNKPALATHASAVSLNADLTGSFQLVATTQSSLAEWSGAYLGPITYPTSGSDQFYSNIVAMSVDYTGGGTGECRLVTRTPSGSESDRGLDVIGGAEGGRTTWTRSYFEWVTTHPIVRHFDLYCRATSGSLTLDKADLTVVAGETA